MRVYTVSVCASSREGVGVNFVVGSVVASRLRWRSRSRRGTFYRYTERRMLSRWSEDIPITRTAMQGRRMAERSNDAHLMRHGHVIVDVATRNAWRGSGSINLLGVSNWPRVTLRPCAGSVAQTLFNTASKLVVQSITDISIQEQNTSPNIQVHG